MITFLFLQYIHILYRICYLQFCRFLHCSLCSTPHLTGETNKCGNQHPTPVTIRLPLGLLRKQAQSTPGTPTSYHMIAPAGSHLTPIAPAPSTPNLSPIAHTPTALISKTSHIPIAPTPPPPPPLSRPTDPAATPPPTHNSSLLTQPLTTPTSIHHQTPPPPPTQHNQPTNNQPLYLQIGNRNLGLWIYTLFNFLQHKLLYYLYFWL